MRFTDIKWHQSLSTGDKKAHLSLKNSSGELEIKTQLMQLHVFQVVKNI
jgi:hypothetical protein